VNQSAIDLCASFITLLGAVVEVDATHMSRDIIPMSRDSLCDQFVCRVWVSRLLLWSLLSSSNYSILLTTFERYFAVVYPMWYKVSLKSIPRPSVYWCCWLGLLTCKREGKPLQKTRLWNDLWCVRWDVKPCTTNHPRHVITYSFDSLKATFHYVLSRESRRHGSCYGEVIVEVSGFQTIVTCRNHLKNCRDKSATSPFVHKKTRKSETSATRHGEVGDVADKLTWTTLTGLSRTSRGRRRNGKKR